MPMYDAGQFDPPAPLARVTLRSKQNEKSVSDVPLLIDTGADVTLIPSSFVNQLGVSAESGKVYELMGFDGSTSFASVVQLEMLFLNKAFRGQFLLIDQEWGVLGRDILNLLSLKLDGPNLSWSEHR